jgi:hypothetical protein
MRLWVYGYRSLDVTDPEAAKISQQKFVIVA